MSASRLLVYFRMHFEWDHRKAAANARKHGVTFEEAASVFGVAAYDRLIVVAHTERHENVRIINARQATAAERKIYEQG